MEIPYSLFDIVMYLLLYSFLGWAAEVFVFAIRDRAFVNRGFLNLPLSLPYGITAVILILVLPTLNNGLLQYLLSMIVFRAVFALSEHFIRGIRRENPAASPEPDRKQRLCAFLMVAVVAAVYLMIYLVIHPMIFALFSLLPELLVKIGVIICSVMIAADFACVLYSLRTHSTASRAEKNQKNTLRLADWMRRAVRHRLEKNYPGILAHQGQKGYTFAEGLCFDKLVWVFLASSFLGALVEMVFCRVTGGTWMNRSSVLYGAFSFVWGFGAVILTITLQHLAGKPDRYVFLAGFIVGGAYEYLCSVFTELVFGTVFWDYSEMPLNIGGRTNVLYCIFWGLLGVVWVKVLYPPMSKGIEKIPALAGKVLTWIVILVMVCNGLLTSAAMLRYRARQEDPTANNLIDLFLDTRYDDHWMENRWPNMKITDG